VFLPILRKISKFQKQSWKFYNFKNPSKVNSIFWKILVFFKHFQWNFQRGKFGSKSQHFLEISPIDRCNQKLEKKSLKIFDENRLKKGNHDFFPKISPFFCHPKTVSEQDYRGDGYGQNGIINGEIFFGRSTFSEVWF